MTDERAGGHQMTAEQNDEHRAETEAILRRRRAEGFGILVVLGVNAAIFTVARCSARLLGEIGTSIATDLLGIAQLAWIMPVALVVAATRPRSGLAKGLAIGAAISFVISAGYCCNDFLQNGHH